MVRVCYGCKEKFRKEELIEYQPLGSKTPHNYCKKCLQEKQERERFSNAVCMIFGIKAPGPRIWTERKRLRETYGYTDQIIIDCLDYIYYILKKQKVAESLYLITPGLVADMQRYKKQQAEKLAQAMNTEVKEYIVPVKENTTVKKETWNPDEWLDEE